MSDSEGDKKHKKDKKEKKDKRHHDDRDENVDKKRSKHEASSSSGTWSNHASEPLDKVGKWDEEPLPRIRTRSLSEGGAENEYPKDQTPEQFRKDNQINVTGSSDDGNGNFKCPDPMTSFASTPYAPPIRRALDAAGFAAPTPTQAQSWPIALAGRDVITVAKTGSGKTCGFLLPAFHRLLEHSKDRRRGPPAILVLAPTRELACQIEEECVKFGRSSNIRSTCAYGGAPKSLQIRKIQGGLEVLIATPGRLNDLLEMGIVNLSQVLFLVLDEADRMLDMGFEPQIRQIVSQIRPDRQTLMWSATWPKEVQLLSRQFQSNPYQVYVGNIETSANVMIKQVIEVCSDREKYMKLLDHLKGFTVDQRVLIFVETKIGAKSLTSSLSREGHRVNDIHGDKSQRDRDTALAEFKSGRTPVLVATDVAARGIDVPDVRMVVNFDMPSNIEDYVHRIGRTGRAGAQGFAVTFFTDKHARMAKELIDILKGSGQVIPPELTKMRHY